MLGGGRRRPAAVAASSVLILRDRQAKACWDIYVDAYIPYVTYLVDRGFKPQLQKLDNEASTMLKRTIKAKGINYQLVPPHIPHRNATERAIKTFKNHFFTCICTTDKHFPMHLWDCLFPQAITTLNLLHTF
jgi:hypothetical protein